MMVATTTDYPPEASYSSQSISTATGDADRAFRDGMALEKLGLARSASASFHEAATLYQCFLDGENSGASIDDGGSTTTTTNVFRRVTSLPSSASAAGGVGGGPTVQSALAYCCLRLAHLSHDAFGDPRASVRLYDLSSNIDPYPGGAAYHGVGICVEASATMTNGGGSSSSSSSRDEGTMEKMAWRNEMERAVNAYREARALGGGLGGNGEVSFHLAVALEVR
jgi:hypothetical protein